MKRAKPTETKLYITAEQDGFTIISNNITRNTLLSDGAKALYIYLKSHSENFNLSVESIAHYLHKCKNTIKKEIKELRENGFLILKRKENSNSYYYELLNSPNIAILNDLSVDNLAYQIAWKGYDFKDIYQFVKKGLITINTYQKVCDRVCEIAKTKYLDDTDE